MSRRTINIQGPVVDLLLDLEQARFQVPEPRLASPREGVWGPVSLSAYRGRLSVDGPRLDLSIDIPEGALHTFIDMMQVRNESARFDLADGSAVSAELAHLRRIGGCAEVVLNHWTWTTSKLPTLWGGQLTGHLPAHGNLVLNERSERTHEIKDVGFRLEGKFIWYLVRGKDKHHHLVVVDTHGQAPTREDLVRETMCLEFSFGVPFDVPFLVGLDAERNAVAACSIGHLVRQTEKQRAPARADILETDLWIPEFFRLLSRKLHTEGLEPLLIAITSYLDAEADHLDGGYLKAQVGLEAFAKRLAGSKSAELLVRDPAAWKDWIARITPEILGHLLSPGSIEIVRGKFMAAMHAPTGELVRRVLATHGIDLPTEVSQEVRKRNYSTHGFLMNAGLEHDIDADVRRLEMIQTLIAALVSCHIGYEGPLNGYDPDR